MPCRNPWGKKQAVVVFKLKQKSLLIFTYNYTFIEYNPTLFSYILISLEYGCKRFGCKTEDVRKAMIARINNIYKAEKVKEKASKE